MARCRLSAVLPVVGGLIGCGGGGSGGPAIQVSSSQGSPNGHEASTVTLVVERENFSGVQVECNGIVVAGVPHGGHFYVHSLPLLPGENDLAVTATRADGGMAVRQLSSQVVEEPVLPVTVSLEERYRESWPGSVQLDLELEVGGTPTNIFVDYDGDGSFDEELPWSPTIELPFDEPGLYLPNITVGMESGVFYSSFDSTTPGLRVLEPSLPDPSLALSGTGPDPSDLEVHQPSGDLFVLSRADGNVRILNQDGDLVETVYVIGISSPEGFAVDLERNIYIADTGNHRVVRLLASTGYEPDSSLGPQGSFGSLGTEPGQFSRPSDVALVEGRDELKVLVADPENGRVQRFGLDGAFELEVRAQDEVQGPLSPSELLALPGAGYLALDSRNGILQLFSEAGVFRESWDVASLSPSASNRGHLSLAPDEGIVVLTCGGLVHLLTPTGSLARSFGPLAEEPTAAAVLTSETQQKLVLVPSALATAAFSSGSERPLDLPVIPVTDDPPGFSPLEEAMGFLRNVALRNKLLAGSRVAPSKLQGFEEKWAKAEVLNAAAARSAAAVDHALEYRRYGIAVVRFSSDLGDGPETYRLVLVREKYGPWQVANF